MTFLAVMSLLLYSCSQEETVNLDDDISTNVAALILSPVLEDFNTSNSRQQITPDETPQCLLDEIPAYAKIRLEYGTENTPIIATVEISKDDQGYFTLYNENLEIPVQSGETTVSVILTDFVVYNDDDVVIWVAPKDDSDYSQFVEEPLSRGWTLRAGSKNYEEVEVICFDDREVNMYGYQFFDITPIPLTDLCVFANYCLTPDGRHRTANYTFDLYTYSGETPEDDPMTNQSLYKLINDENRMPNTGLDGEVFYADPLCMTIPKGDDDNGDIAYLYWKMSLEDWDDYYGEAPDLTLSGYLTWNEVKAYLHEDGDDSTTDYIHLFFNCDDGDTGECDLSNPDADCDDDGTLNGVDCEPNNPANNTSRENDADCDGVPTDEDCDDDNNQVGRASTTYYADTDGDGLGDPNDSIVACTQPEGYVDNDSDPCPDDSGNTCEECDFDDPDADCDDDGTLNGVDCEPNNPANNTSRENDADCDGVPTDEDCDDDNNQVGRASTTYYADTDGDGLGDPNDSIVACTQPDGYVDNDSDPCPDDPDNTCEDECDPTEPEDDCDDDTILNKCDTDNPNWATFDCDGDGVLNGQDNCANENPDLDYDMDGCEDIPDSCEFITDNDCSFLIWDQTTASGGNPIYGIDLDNENIGSVEIQINGDSDVEIDFNLDIDYLLDDIYIVLDDGTTRCASNLGQGLNNFVFEGTFSEQQSILIYANVCPATAN
ncbi:hypothetical protein SAMN04488552_2543 [Christiangramia echinicola]|uniref:Thrombospondin type 3 repeat-containing protein n=2 Tax=Christiangramia echinicola TaxID=279359 RepID=A0A1H1QM53_9FLAO|nr:hypothetical protein SAMN04488552_2543 [Christiangramia echinicola]